MDKLIAIEGLDGSGKHTQSKMLYEYLKSKGTDVKLLSFPDYKSDSSAIVKQYLNGDLGQDVSPYAAASFFAGDIYSSYKNGWGELLKKDTVCICDRYATSNAIYQSARLKTSEERKQFLKWLDDFQYNKMGLPKPDMVIYLDVSVDISQQLLTKRYMDGGKRDIHERDLYLLSETRKMAEWHFLNDGWFFIPCSNNLAMDKAYNIQYQIQNIVNRCLNNINL